MISRDQIHDLILTRLWGPCEVISDETDAKVFEAADAIIALSEGKSTTEGDVERLRYFSAALRDHYTRTEDLKVLAHDCEVHADDIDSILADLAARPDEAG